MCWVQKHSLIRTLAVGGATESESVTYEFTETEIKASQKLI